jgi:hypothetical protein
MLIFHPSEDFFRGCTRSFSYRSSMGRCEWTAWMWFAHETTPAIHNALVTWSSVGGKLATRLWWEEGHTQPNVAGIWWGRVRMRHHLH